MILQVVGCSHHQSGVEIRERLAFSETQSEQFLANFYTNYPAAEAVLLSTCNRTEWYVAAATSAELPSPVEMKRRLSDARKVPPEEFDRFLFELTDVAAIEHLFSVAAGLDSMVVGETQILSQVKQAYQSAVRINPRLSFCHRLFQAANKVAKRISTETSIHQNRVSIPSIAIGDFARQIFERLDDKRILVIGAGEMAKETLTYVSFYGGKDIVVVNRTLDAGYDLAKRFGGRVVEWLDLARQVVSSDLIISATGAQEPVVTDSDYRKIEVERNERPLFVLDLAIPRDFDPAIGNRDNVFLYSIDDLQAQCEHNRRHRQSFWPQAKKIVELELQIFQQEWSHRLRGPAIAQLKAQADEVKEAELRRLVNRLGPISDSQRREIEAAFHRLTNKLLHPPLESLKKQANQTDPQLIEAIKQLFKLPD